MSDDTPNGLPGERKPLPKFPWEEGYVAPTESASGDAPTQAYTPPAQQPYVPPFTPSAPLPPFTPAATTPPAAQPPAAQPPYTPPAQPPVTQQPYTPPVQLPPTQQPYTPPAASVPPYTPPPANPPYTPPAATTPPALNPDLPTERFDAQQAAQVPPSFPNQPVYPPAPSFLAQPIAPAADLPTEIFGTPQSTPPLSTTEPTAKYDALPSDDPFGPGGMFGAGAFVEHSDDLIPTERFSSTDVASPAASNSAYPTRSNGARRTTTTPPKKSNALMITLISVAGVLLVAIIVLVIILFLPKGETPVALPTDTASAPAPSETAPAPVETPDEPETVGPTFTTFEAPETSGCQEGDSESPLTFSWASDDAVRAYIGIGTENARDDAYDGDLPPTYTYDLISYLCDQESQIYTVSLEDANGELTNETVTVTR